MAKTTPTKGPDAYRKPTAAEEAAMAAAQKAMIAKQNSTPMKPKAPATPASTSYKKPSGKAVSSSRATAAPKKKKW